MIFNAIYGTEVESVMDYIKTTTGKQPTIKNIESYITIAQGGDYHLIAAHHKRGLYSDKQRKKFERELKDKKKTKIDCAIGDFFIGAHILFESILDTENRISISPEKAFVMMLFASSMSHLKQCDHFFNEFQKIARGLSGSYESAKKKRQTINIIEQIIMDNGIRRPRKWLNPISSIIQTIRTEYLTRTGRPLKLNDGTIENHVYDYFNRH